MRELGKAEIKHITLGATMLATGGGGDPYIGSIMTMDMIDRYGPVKLLSVDELPDDGLFVTVGMIGAPTVLIEKLPSGDEALQACEALAAHLGKKVDGIYPIEAGGINSLLPIAAAARLGLPIIDMDGIGRAFPELQMTTFHLDGINFTPMSVVDEKCNQNVIVAKDAVWGERLARAACSRMGGSAVFAGCPITGAQAKQSSIRDILSLEQKIGATMASASERGVYVIDEILQLLHAHLLFNGKVIEVDRRTEAGFANGIARLEGLGLDKGKYLEVQFQNEYLIARADKKLLCATPDLISLLDEETGVPVLTERLRYGARLKAIGIPAHPKWRTPAGIAVAGPRYFKYDTDYVPVELLTQNQR